MAPANDGTPLLRTAPPAKDGTPSAKDSTPASFAEVITSVETNTDHRRRRKWYSNGFGVLFISFEKSLRQGKWSEHTQIIVQLLLKSNFFNAFGKFRLTKDYHIPQEA